MILPLLTTLALTVMAHAATGSVAENRKTVLNFYNLAFNNHKPADAVDKFVGARYVQHNPLLADGKKPFIDFFVKYQKQHPEAHADIKHIAAEGDLVFLHVHSVTSPTDAGRAGVYIFRLENGKIVEHWDVNQSVPEKPANTNTMF